MFGIEEWQKLSPLLDEVLELPPGRRESWLEELATRDAGLAATLSGLLAEKAAIDTGGFLEDSPAPLLTEPTASGQRLGAWELDRPIGQGGMGAVWLAHRCDGRYEGDAAVKLLNAALVGGPAEQRFIREGSVLATLRHPNIAHLVDAGVTGVGQPYLVLEHVEGMPIDRYCDEYRLGLRARVRVFLDVLAAVGYAHRHLVVHRDLKPANVLVAEDGLVKLLDFGIATLLQPAMEEARRHEWTREIGAAMTPEYAAPEQLFGEAVTTATDIYALGRVLHALLTGRPCVAPPAGADAVRAAFEHEPSLASESADEEATKRLLRGDLDNILRKALKADPAERYATAEAFADDLRRYLADEPVAARADSLRYRIRKFVRRHRGGVLSGAITALALVGITVFAVLQMFEAERQRDEADAQRRRAEGYSTAITGLLSQAGPGGRALTPSELLGRAVEQVEATYADDPALLVHMLIMISGRYYDLQNTNLEYDTLVRAERAARASGDPSLVFRVQCNTVETELEAGRHPEAVRRLQEAMRLLPVLAIVPAGDHAACLRAGAQIASADGDMDTALAQLEKGLRVLEDAGRAEGNAYSGILSMLAAYTADSGDLLGAHGHWTELVELDRRLGRENSRPGQIARISLASSFAHLGEIKHAEGMFRAILAGMTPGGPEKMFLGRALARLGRHEEALRLVREAVVEMDASGHERFRIRTRLALAEALLLASRPAEAMAALEEAAGLMRNDPVRYRYLGLDADGLRARILLAEGEIALAARQVDAALVRDAAARQSGAGRAALLRSRGRIQLAGGRVDDAADSARAAVALFEQSSLDPTQNADLGEALLVLAQCERAAGDTAAAGRSLERAIVSLQNGLGADHGLTRLARQLAGSS